MDSSFSVLKEKKNMENIFDSRFEVFSQSEFEVITAARN